MFLLFITSLVLLFFTHGTAHTIDEVVFIVLAAVTAVQVAIILLAAIGIGLTQRRF